MSLVEKNPVISPKKHFQSRFVWIIYSMEKLILAVDYILSIISRYLNFSISLVDDALSDERTPYTTQSGSQLCSRVKRPQVGLERARVRRSPDVCAFSCVR